MIFGKSLAENRVRQLEELKEAGEASQRECETLRHELERVRAQRQREREETAQERGVLVTQIERLEIEKAGAMERFRNLEEMISKDDLKGKAKVCC